MGAWTDLILVLIIKDLVSELKHTKIKNSFYITKGKKNKFSIIFKMHSFK